MISALKMLLRRHVGNRRRAPRVAAQRQARLLFSISFPAEKTSIDIAGRILPLEGRTRDLSATGLALIVSAPTIDDQYLTSEHRTLRIELELPTKPVEIQAVPVRYVKLDESEMGTGYLIGAHIKEMSDSDRARFIEYLRMLH